MERLTQKLGGTAYISNLCKDIECEGLCYDCGINRMIERLAAYEDIELMPEEIVATLMNYISFLSEMTGGRMSKTNYTVEAMVSVANDHFQSICDECREDKHATELLDAESEGRLLVLPVRVGDEVYIVEHDEAGDFVDDYEVIYFYISSTGVNRIYASRGTAHKNFRPKEIGKTVFLTREEAESALKGEGNG